MKDLRLQAASWLCVPFAIYAVIAPCKLLLPSHAFDKSWPTHARFHLFWASGKLVAIGISQFLLARCGLATGQRWAWCALLSNILFGGFVIVPASRIAHGPIAPFHAHDRSTRMAVGVFVSALLGLLLAAPVLFGRSEARRGR